LEGEPVRRIDLGTEIPSLPDDLILPDEILFPGNSEAFSWALSGSSENDPEFAGQRSSARVMACTQIPCGRDRDAGLE
jgi:hypothetical protein